MGSLLEQGGVSREGCFHTPMPFAMKVRSGCAAAGRSGRPGRPRGGDSSSGTKMPPLTSTATPSRLPTPGPEGHAFRAAGCRRQGRDTRGRPIVRQETYTGGVTSIGNTFPSPPPRPTAVSQQVGQCLLKGFLMVEPDHFLSDDTVAVHQKCRWDAQDAAECLSTSGVLISRM